MKAYPQIFSEEQTVDRILDGASIARFGDGEWRCAMGGGCTSQRPDPKMASELKLVLRSQGPRFIVGLPNVFGDCPKKVSWVPRYTSGQILGMLKNEPYYSSFITRPDNAPWIDNTFYWDKVRKIWQGENIVLVVGLDKSGSGAEKKSLTREMLSDAASVYEVIGPRQHAYEAIDELEREIVRVTRGIEHPRVVMCLGVTATVLAHRLSMVGLHAIDIGHIGMFMRHAGAYRYTQSDLVSPAYRRQLHALHTRERWGTDGAKHAARVEQIASAMDALTILDYGCGEATLEAALKPKRRVSNYDPGIPTRDGMPKPCDLVVCTDVLEHVEPDKLDAVIDHLYRLTARRAYLVISTRPANAKLPDGRNAHLIVQPAAWWREKLTDQGFRLENEFEGKNHLEVEAVK